MPVRLHLVSDVMHQKLVFYILIWIFNFIGLIFRKSWHNIYTNTLIIRYEFISGFFCTLLLLLLLIIIIIIIIEKRYAFIDSRIRCILLCIGDATCEKFTLCVNSVVRAFAHCAMCPQIDPSWWTHWTISRSSQCSMTDVTMTVVCVILSVGWFIKQLLLLIGKVAHMAAADFLSRYLNGSIPYV